MQADWGPDLPKRRTTDDSRRASAATNTARVLHSLDAASKQRCTHASLEQQAAKIHWRKAAVNQHGNTASYGCAQNGNANGEKHGWGLSVKADSAQSYKETTVRSSHFRNARQSNRFDADQFGGGIWSGDAEQAQRKRYQGSRIGEKLIHEHFEWNLLNGADRSGQQLFNNGREL